MGLRGNQRPFLGSAADDLLVQGLDAAKQTKIDLRAELARINRPLALASPNPPVPPRRFAPAPLPPTPGAAADPDENPVQNATCTVDYNANSKITRIIGRARVKRTMAQLAPVLDPRSWSATGSVIGAAFPVVDDNGVYKPRRDLDDQELGKPWKGLLYEYARSDVASFENILSIDRFTGMNAKRIEATYHLYDCLVCTFGMISAPGGLTVNQGHGLATPVNDEWSDLEVLKEIKVRDLTPHDPGRGYDFGQWINSTIGAALSQWVDDTSMMSPIV
jgi:hypothetical protein